MSLYDFYMYLKYIEHSSENLEFYVWYVILDCRNINILADHMSRFKNYEMGRLTVFPELHRTGTSPTNASFTDSEKSLAKAENNEKFPSSSITDMEAQDNSEFENGEPLGRKPFNWDMN